jgi:hypothetical protein
MKLLDVIKRAILEGKLDTELGITDGDVMQRFDKVIELIDKPIQLPTFNEVPRVDWESLLRTAKPQMPVNSPFDWKNKVWCSTPDITFDKDFHDKYSKVLDFKEVLDNEKN